MQIQPILAALRRHRLATLLITLQIALACAVLSNASFLISQRISRMHAPSGVDNAQLAEVSVEGFAPDQASNVNARMLAMLRGTAGVSSAALINAVPFGDPAANAGIKLDPSEQGTHGVMHFYVGGPGAFQALGLKVVEGRAPQAGDYQPVADFTPKQAPVVITRALATSLWPQGHPLGKSIWIGSRRFRVIGVVKGLIRPAPFTSSNRPAQGSIFVPGQPGPQLVGRYLIRVATGQMDSVLERVRKAVRQMGPQVVLDEAQTASVESLHSSYFQTDRSMVALLLGVVAALLLVTALGMVGLASFWVSQRTRQIGVRRALGATQGAILRYFQTENLLIVSAGIALGVVMAFALNVLLMQYYEVPRLPLGYLPVGALALWLLGQLAVLSPALRASRVPPVVATRSV
ncbi:FtsX-like permease family protein [Oleiagrimonas sp. C23AA]|uniref:ABC transporter permease n=1 Tax=Oleiagrimonas sp. C23AA TaxID=2719047 RepID=UPI0014206982|nr:FtsX-like permease family protein [Oleiagrimonas sp. C23AA]NII12038.1 FtsX-like permease family protein [Oleiagrimonas sp. C23AA]